MKTRIHLPITYQGRKVKIIPTQPVIFLAGPIRNAPHWHDEAIKFLLNENADVFIASPRRTIHADLIKFVELDNNSYEIFERQRTWERYYLDAASENGCIVFYLPKESEIKDDPNKVYAHITMMELGEWIARYKHDREIGLIVATDGNFPEWSTVKYELEQDGIPYVDSLEKGLKYALSHIELDHKINK